MCTAWKRNLALLSLVTTTACLIAFGFSSQHASAAVGINQQLSFQGKLVNKTVGTNIPDGTYDMEFKIYQDGNGTPGGGGTQKWVQDFIVGTSSVGVPLTNGTFQVNLGGTAAPFTGVDWNQDTLWLSIQIGGTTTCTPGIAFQTNCGGDGEMNPYIRLTSTPYALNADKLDGIDSTAFGQLATANTWTAANKIQTANNFALQVQNASNNVFNVDTTANQVKVFDGAATQGFISFTAGNTSSTIASSAALILNSTGANSITLDSTTTGAVNVATGANAKTVIIGNQTTGTTVTLNSGGNINLSPIAGGDVVFSQGAGSQLQLTASAPPTSDQLAISNAGQGVATAGVNGLSINYVGGAAAVEASGERIDLTSGSANNSTWNGLRIVGNAAASGVTENGIKLDPIGNSIGTAYGIVIGSGWNTGLNIASVTNGDPPAPANDTLDLYVRKTVGRPMLAALGTSSTGTGGASYTYQPSLFQQSVFMCSMATTTTTIASLGGSCVAVGTAAAVTPTEATGEGINYKSTASAPNVAGIWQQTVASYFRGTVTHGSNGFFYSTRFYTSDASYGSGATGSRFFAGFTDQATATTMTAGDNPAGNYAGLQYSTNRGDTNWMCITKDGTTQATPVSTGVAFSALKMYDAYVYTPPKGTTVYMRIDNLTDGTIGECSMGSNLPTAATAMRPEIFVGTLTTAARGINFQHMYVETDR